MLSADQPPAATHPVIQSTGSVVRVLAPKDLMEQEYRKLLEMDDEAQDEVDGWIRGEVALNEQGAAMEPAQLTAKVEARLQPVRDAYEAFLKRHPGHARARLAFGSFLNDTRDEAGAFVQWEKARELDPKNPAVWNNLANYHGHCGPVRKSFEYYAKAIELNPSEPIYYQNLATTVFLFRKDAGEFYGFDEKQVFDRALELYHKALKLAPKDFLLACDLAQTYYGIRPPRHEDALKAWEAALPLARNDIEREGIQIHLARTKINLGRFDDAKKHLDLVGLDGYATIKARLLRNLEEKRAKAAAPTAEAR
jgi:tetratricopeptide (TPR) repeat protein